MVIGLIRSCNSVILKLLGSPPFRLMLIWLLVHLLNLNFCLCLNREGLALLRFKDRLVRDPFDALSTWTGVAGADINDPCFWFGIHCANGTVVALTLRNLSLEGTLAPELGELAYLESIILRNNSFSSHIPKEIVELSKLKVLDLGQNNFTGLLPFELGLNPSLAILLLDSNHFLGYVPTQPYNHMLSEFQVYETQIRSTSSGYASGNKHDFVRKRLLLAELFKGSQQKQNMTASSMPPKSSSTFLPPSHLSSKQGIKKSNSSLLSPVHSPAFPPHSLPKTRVSPPRSSSKTSANPPRSAGKLSPSPSPLLPPSASPLPPLALSPTPLLSPSSSPPSLSLSRPPTPTPVPVPIIVTTPPSNAALVFSTPPANFALDNSTSSWSSHKVLVWASVAGGSLFLMVTAVGIFICRNSKVVTVKPWATGLSGKLRKALISGVPKLKRAELETACEDFSNIIGTLEDSIVYKGTLSNGTEIAVVSSMVKSHQQWSKSLEAQFRKKVETLSKINHKNFVNLIGYCEEERPFTRMMIFEYAPSGTLFEHLHIKEAERLDWSMRLRIIMGMAYCLDHMHQLSPPMPHRDLQSSSVYLTEDYAAKVSDLSFWNEVTTPANKMRSPSMRLLEESSSLMTTNTESNVQSFGVILLEVITGRIPYSADNGSIEDWVWEYLSRDKLSQDFIDPTLDDTVQEEEMQKLLGVIKDCVHSDLKVRPTMRDVTVRLKEITTMEPDEATPRVSPLWWAELEILSTEGT